MDNDEKLINCVRDFPALWDKTSKSYHNKIAKANCWQSVSLNCGFESVAACKARWKALREKMRREETECDKITRSGAKLVLRKPWPLMAHMEFIKDTETPRVGLPSNMPQIVIQEQIEEGSDEDDEGTLILQHNNNSNNFMTQLHNYAASPSCSTDPFDGGTSESVTVSTVATQKGKKKKQAEGNSDGLSNLMDKIGATVDEIQKRQSKSDVNSDKYSDKYKPFASYICQQLENLPEKDAETLMDDFVMSIMNKKRRLL